jgi:hypothetical protein
LDKASWTKQLDTATQAKPVRQSYIDTAAKNT